MNDQHLINPDDDWDNVREFNEYRLLPANILNQTPVAKSLDNTGPIFCNLTDFIPIYLFSPYGNKHRYQYKDLDKVFYTRILRQITSGMYRATSYGLTSSTIEFPLRKMRLRPSRPVLQTFSDLAVSYMLCVEYQVLSGIRLSPKILWAGVVPIGTSLDFHYNFLNMKTIVPEEYGLEFWYDISGIKKWPRLFRHFNENVITRMGHRAFGTNGFKLIGKPKTQNQMQELFLPDEAFYPKFRTLEEQDIYGQKVVHEVLKTI